MDANSYIKELTQRRSELKFRLWNSIDNVMYLPENVKFKQGEWPVTYAMGIHGKPIAIDSDSFKENIIIGWNVDHTTYYMQYAGINDKDDKDIYECDIVEVELIWEELDDHEKKFNRHIDKYIGVVTFNEGSFYFKRILSEDELKKHQGSFPGSLTDMEISLNSFIDYDDIDGESTETHIKVLGNIYENPELFKFLII